MLSLDALEIVEELFTVLSTSTSRWETIETFFSVIKETLFAGFESDFR